MRLSFTKHAQKDLAGLEASQRKLNTDDQNKSGTSYLLGDSWVLKVYARCVSPAKQNGPHFEKIEITASYDSKEF